MIRSLSETLEAVLTDPQWKTTLPELGGAQIVFDRPVDDFNPSLPTVELFLYDVRENMELRSNEPQVTRSQGQVTITRPPLRVSCSYLVTAWPPSHVTGKDAVMQEQRLLSETLEALASFPTFPASYLRDKLVGQTPPLPMVTARADGLKDPSEFWTAIGAKLRASLVVSATISIDPIAPAVTGPPVLTSKLTVNQLRFTIAGVVTGGDGQPAIGANVTLSELRLAAVTDDQGRYVLGAMPKGTYTLNAVHGAVTKQVSVTVPAVSPVAYDITLPSPGTT
jgi:hypothetical protein